MQDFDRSIREIAADYFHDIELDQPAWTAARRITPSEKIVANKKQWGDKPKDEAEILGPPVATYRYLDVNGNVIAAVTRYEPKTFRPWCFREIDGEMKWMIGSPPVRPIYHLPEVSKSDVVVLVEGEGKADALATFGVVTTSLMGGANAVAKTDWTPLQGKTVVVWPDNDAPGRNFCTDATAALLSIGCKVFVVQIPADKPEKWDCANCIREGGDAGALVAAAVEVAGNNNDDGSQGAAGTSGANANASSDDAAGAGGTSRSGQQSGHQQQHGRASGSKPDPDLERHELLVSAWRQRELPPRDYLLDGVLCTTSRWLVIGETGVGKTLFGLELGFAVAAAANFLIWKGVRPARVMYLDGEMPAETLKERVESAASVYGEVELYAYNRDVIGDGAMPPLNGSAGQQWLWREIEAVKPDLIIFDAIMSLLVGPLSEEETWLPMTPLIRQISSQRIGQVWLHHTGHDTSKGFGTKTMQWQLDTVLMLTKNDGDRSLTLEFSKARLRRPETEGLFKPQTIRRDAPGWTSEPGNVKPKESASERKRAWFQQVYNNLALDVTPSPGHTAAPVRKVAITAIRGEMIKRGFLATEDGKLPARERVAFQRAREELLRSGQFATDGTAFWRVK
ncbi:AAA family ATPase [Bradyrhizobium yuanmingense]|uniref:AAA family ATPase n=1 Tax=Bradyrhizobium yuanmingense TaxID=108015 RepID=UPI003514E41C